MNNREVVLWAWASRPLRVALPVPVLSVQDLHGPGGGVRRTGEAGCPQLQVVTPQRKMLCSGHVSHSRSSGGVLDSQFCVLWTQGHESLSQPVG